MASKRISIVLPVFNEEESISKLHKEITAVCEKLSMPYEIIAINDGSNDDTLNVLKKLKPIKIVSFRKNFGQTAALDAGVKIAKGDYILALDADGQNDPRDFPRLIKKLEKDGLDVVSGWRRKRKDNFSKKISSRAAAFIRKILINDGIHDSGCTLKIYKKACFDSVELSGEMHRFIPALLKIKGFEIGEIEVNHRPRTAGKTKYNWKRGVKGNLDMFSIWFWKKFASRPLHLFGAVGLLSILVSAILMTLLLYGKIINSYDLSDTAVTTFALILFVAGIQLLVFGLLADILSKIYFSGSKDERYSISEIIENKK